jgi:opacity protein-like surface antigen
MIRSLAIMATLIFTTLPARAQDGGVDLILNPYFGVGLGGFELDYGNGKDFVFGGYGTFGLILVENLAAEIRLGTTSSSSNLDPVLGKTVDKSVNWFVSYVAKPQFEISPGLRIYGLLGATTIQTAITPLGSVERSSTDTSFSFGVGAEYAIQDQLYIGAEWMRYSSNKDRVAVTPAGGFNGMDVNGFVGTLRYEF